tara:strand:+ start:2004 stop:2315 length:312 start_codon:yes stop_codon:yes gene_type:complete
MSNLLKICNLNEIPEDTLQKKEIEGHSIILIRKNNVVHVIEDQCSHMNYPLSDGELDHDEIECLYHGAKFNIKSGKPTCLPATEDIKIYEVIIKDEEVFIVKK